MRRIKHLTHLQLAKLSEYELESRRAACVARGRTWGIVCVASLLGPAGVVLVLDLVVGLRIPLDADARHMLAPLIAFFSVALSCVPYRFGRQPVLAWAEDLAPLAESNSGCIELLAAARKRADVKLWVETAVANGRQLRHFDLAAAEESFQLILRKIEAAEALRLKEKDRQRKEMHAAACRELHGLPVDG